MEEDIDVDSLFKKYGSYEFIKGLVMVGDMLKIYEKLDIKNTILPLSLEVKGLVAMSFRNGPIEDIHADGRISQEEMKKIMKYAVNELYFLLRLREVCPEYYKVYILPLFPGHWDDPVTKELDYGDICQKYYDAKKKELKIKDLKDEKRRCEKYGKEMVPNQSH